MLYSGGGDKGYTTLFGKCTKFSKSSPLIEALGALDELNSLLGFCRAKATKQKDIFKYLKESQNNIFIIQARLAGSEKNITPKTILELENSINKIEKSLPTITSFIMPGSSEMSALLDYARAVSRRTERRVVSVQNSSTKHPLVLQYLNRLSSLLFALARLANKNQNIKEDRPNY